MYANCLSFEAIKQAYYTDITSSFYALTHIHAPHSSVVKLALIQ